MNKSYSSRIHRYSRSGKPKYTKISRCGTNYTDPTPSNFRKHGDIFYALCHLTLIVNKSQKENNERW